MISVKKKRIMIFSDGSLLINKFFFQNSPMAQITNKDHTTFLFNKKNNQVLDNSKDSKNFKTKYFNL